MRGNTHMIIGATAGAAVAAGVGLPLSLEWIGVLMLATVAALAPDIDQPGSTIARRLPLIALLPFGAHRGFTHSLLALALVSAGLMAAQVDRRLALAVAAGYASHIAADAVTITGVSLLYPLRRRIRLVPAALAVGSVGESFVIMAAIGVAIYLLR
jgi:inner membrane protein